MSREIFGIPVGTTLPKPNLLQDDPKKGDYVYGKEEFLANAKNSIGNTVYYVDDSFEYPVPGVDVYRWGVDDSKLSVSGRGIDIGDLVISQNNVLCRVVAISNATVAIEPIAKLDASGGAVPDCVIEAGCIPAVANDYKFSVTSGSLMNVWEKVHNGEKPRVLLKFLVSSGSDSDNYIAEAHFVEHYASGGDPSLLRINFVVEDKLFVFESVSPDSITGNVITGHTTTKLGEVQGGTVTDEHIESVVEGYMADNFGGNTIYYLNGNMEYKPGGVYFNSIASSSLSNEGRGVKVGDLIISSNNVLCKVTSVENSQVYYSQFAQLGVPTDDHINNLINSALGVIENGTY